MNRFSIEYPEFHISNTLSEYFKKKDDFSISIPLNRQQKHYDLLLFKADNKKCMTIQVKSSRTWMNFKKKKRSKKTQYNFESWIQNFSNKYGHVSDLVDYFFIFITYPEFDTETFRPKTKFNVKTLVFKNSEMNSLFQNIKRTKSGNPERFFGFGFNIAQTSIYGSRGLDHLPNIDYTNHLFENRIEELTDFFK